jgi:hypothetical protein
MMRGDVCCLAAALKKATKGEGYREKSSPRPWQEPENRSSTDLG